MHSSSPAELKYAAWNGTGWTRETVDPTAEPDLSVSLALDTAGNPRIAYCDTNNGDLKYAVRTGSAWSIQPVDSGIAVDPSLALDGAGTPRIAYYDIANQDLKYAVWSGSSWSIQTVDGTGNVGMQPSLALGSGGNPRIAYVDLTGGRIKYAAWTGTAWAFESMGSISTVLTGAQGSRPSLALDSGLNPRIAYYDNLDRSLKYAVSAGSGWNVETVESAAYVGYWPSLVISGDTPRITYFDSANDRLKYAAKPLTTWQTEIVANTGESQTYTSMAIAGGNPQIAFFSGDLKLARSVPSSPAIDVETEVSVDGGATWQDADSAPGPSVVAGRLVKWRYVVRNTGNIPLAPVWVEDDREDVTPTAPRNALAAGESMTATYDGLAVAGQHACTGTAYGAYGTSGALTVQDADAANYLGLALLAVPPGTALPTDGDDDGLYEDVNGNGRRDFADVVLYFNQMTWIAANEPVVAFDFNTNGRVDFADVVWLFNHL